MQTTITEKSRAWRPRQVWEWADKYADRIQDILPSVYKPSVALATCYFTVIGKNGYRNPELSGDDWGPAVECLMQTHGHCPILPGTMQRRKNWARISTFDGMDRILRYFGTSWRDFVDTFSMPDDGHVERYNLYDVVKTLCPQFT